MVNKFGGLAKLVCGSILTLSTLASEVGCAKIEHNHYYNNKPVENTYSKKEEQKPVAKKKPVNYNTNKSGTNTNYSNVTINNQDLEIKIFGSENNVQIKQEIDNKIETANKVNEIEQVNNQNVQVNVQGSENDVGVEVNNYTEINNYNGHSGKTGQKIVTKKATEHDCYKGRKDCKKIPLRIDKNKTRDEEINGPFLVGDGYQDWNDNGKVDYTCEMRGDNVFGKGEPISFAGELPYGSKESIIEIYDRDKKIDLPNPNKIVITTDYSKGKINYEIKRLPQGSRVEGIEKDGQICSWEILGLPRGDYVAYYSVITNVIEKNRKIEVEQRFDTLGKRFFRVGDN